MAIDNEQGKDGRGQQFFLFDTENIGVNRYDQFIEALPITPGIFYFYNKNGECLYLGYAGSISNKVKEIFYENPEGYSWLLEVDLVDWQVVAEKSEGITREYLDKKRLRPLYCQPGAIANSFYLCENSTFNHTTYRFAKEYPDDDSFIVGTYTNISGLSRKISSLKHLYDFLIHEGPFRIQNYMRLKKRVFEFQKVNDWDQLVASFFRGESDKILSAFRDRIHTSRFLDVKVRDFLLGDLQRVERFFQTEILRNRNLKLAFDLRVIDRDLYAEYEKHFSEHRK